VFTGLVAELGRIRTIERSGDGVRLGVETALAGELGEGDSVALNGVCLTATEVAGGAFHADVMNQTLSLTSLGALRPGTSVNLELPLRPADRLGGHVVQGHVDGVGHVTDIADDGFARRVTIDAPRDVLRYVIPKGSIAVDGVSLTVAELRDRCFTVSLIPETQQRTNLGAAQPGGTVNLEVDVLAKYVERLLPRPNAEDLDPGAAPDGSRRLQSS
jgi:riboflavin synthase